ncbi:hypothetical protein ABRY23_12015 [Melioribacteraceae bacterium 4301-Me]|uniref:hypothetical protein n=1 Tax=Pyranulibacter aquaticus TaxID=3163344 RepID=UPI00359B8234
MGQQQLLLIVLGVIIVGIAIVVGINVFTASSEQSAKDTIVSQATNIGSMAQQYYRKPKALGGGNNSFVGFTIPAKLATDSAAQVTFSLSGVTDSSATITGTPFPSTGYSWTTITTVTRDNITTKIQ